MLFCRLPQSLRPVSTTLRLRITAKHAYSSTRIMSSADAPLATPRHPTRDPHPGPSQSEGHAWKERPPYRIQSPEEFGEVKWTAKCQCGQVEYKLNREKPLLAKFCHCRGCQVMHGAPFQWAAIFHKSDITFTKGGEGLSFYSSAHGTRDYEVPTKVSCSFCRSPIMDEGRNVCLIYPSLIDFHGSEDEQRDRRRAFYPSCHIFYRQRCVEVYDGVTKWAGMDEDSEQLDDHGKTKQ